MVREPMSLSSSAAPAAAAKAPSLHIAMVGHAFMGRAHGNAFRQANHFFDLPFRVVPASIVGRDQERATAAAPSFGFRRATTDLDAVLADPAIHVVDVATPNDSHHAIAMAALAGEEARAVREAAGDDARAGEGDGGAGEEAEGARRPVAQLPPRAGDRAGGEDDRARRPRRDPPGARGLPAGLARRRVRAGELAHQQEDLRQRRARRPQRAPDRPDAGADRARVRVGHAACSRRSRSSAPTATAGIAKVDVDDAFLFLARFRGGAIGTYEATRTAPGRKNHNCIEISGEKGSLRWNLERMNELEVFSVRRAARRQGFRTMMCMDSVHPYAANWWPDGHIVGYEHTFVHHVADFVRALHDGDAVRAGTSRTASRCRRCSKRRCSRRRTGPGSRCLAERLVLPAHATHSPGDVMMKGPGIFLAQFMSDQAPLTASTRRVDGPRVSTTPACRCRRGIHAAST
jgi:predicted dehydrogenase